MPRRRIATDNPPAPPLDTSAGGINALPMMATAACADQTAMHLRRLAID